MKTLFLSLTLCFGLISCSTAQKEKTEGNENHEVSLRMDKFTKILAGNYEATFPCADCPGIAYKLELNRDMTFSSVSTYLERDSSFSEKGDWSIQKGGKLVLENNEGVKTYFKMNTVGNLTKLDMNGNEITGSTADLYKLNKVAKQSEVVGKQTRSFDTATINGTFLLIAFDQGEFPIPADKAHPTFKFNSKEKTVTGFAGCNNARGTFSNTDTEIHFGPMATTRKACFDDEYESKVLKAFKEATNYTLEGDQLSLKKGENVIMVFRKLNF
ncbi:hypothetical protein UJ101_00152 [Flavobacteriaceae bacterium UJ101]|nr:hypothetical protein UJ101_00152 [Flavobacteriaceae bacterium UJ101]